MKILVAVKRVIDYNAKIRVKSDGSGVESDHVKWSLNPFDEIAVEQAVRLKEQGIANEIVVASGGSESCCDILRRALAMGADRAILIRTDSTLEPLHVATLLSRLVAMEQPTLVLLGKQAIDDDCNQTGQMLAGLLGWSQATFVSQLHIANDEARVIREVDGGLETLVIKLPAVVTTDLRLNEPRYPSLPNIMRAKTKPLTQITCAELNVALRDHVATTHVAAPATKNPGIKVNSIKELINILKVKNKVVI